MAQDLHLEPTVMVIAGASGDLTGRKIIPAIYNLFLDHSLPERFRVVGAARTRFSDEEFRRQLRDRVDQILAAGQNNGRATGSDLPGF